MQEMGSRRTVREFLEVTGQGRNREEAEINALAVAMIYWEIGEDEATSAKLTFSKGTATCYLGMIDDGRASSASELSWIFSVDIKFTFDREVS